MFNRIFDGLNTHNRNEAKDNLRLHQDAAIFSQLSGGNTETSTKGYSSNRLTNHSDYLSKQLVDASIENMASSVATIKNEMILKSAGSSAKKTTEIAKEITF